MHPIDLRSDTVTQPTEAMRAAMAAAEVGDDVYGEDPTVARLEQLAAAVVGKERGLFVPSGTMGNLIAVKAHTEPGDEAVLERSCHILLYELGGMAWLSGVMPRGLDGDRGILSADQIAANTHRDVPHYRARTGVICLENSHNFAGGTTYPQAELDAIGEVGRRSGVPVHLDGARIFNAAVAQAVSPKRICAPVDSVMFCFSKGLSAPVGSILCGTDAFIEKARRIRRAVGGGLRQVGVIAAAALVAMETMVDRLREDHARASRLAVGLAEMPGVRLDPNAVETNILVFQLDGGALSCARWMEKTRSRGVLCSQMSEDLLRLVTHRHIGDGEVDRALQVFSDVSRSIVRRAEAP